MRLEQKPMRSLARWWIVCEGYAEPGVASTIALVQDGSQKIVVDPGMVRHPRRIVDRLGRLGVKPLEVTDVILSHHHPDHTLNAGLFPKARVHDHWAIYRGDQWVSRPAEGFQVSPSVRLLATPGHTREDITTVAGTAAGFVAFTHLWWFRKGPREDPLGVDRRRLHQGRRRVLAFASWIVPGHGPAFVPDTGTFQ
jgi:glyoxylase-like metal-dependent hydrolase (beta-lactamase superfamily II)